MSKKRDGRSPDAPAHSITAPLAVWLIVQLAALALAATRVRLSAHFVEPVEALAVDEMVVVQFAASAMLFPLLLRDARHCLAMMLTALPMLQLAAVLAVTPTPRVIGAWTCVALWLAALTLWRALLPDRRGRGIAIAIANFLTLGGLLIGYLAAEFAAAGDGSVARFFPLLATLRFLRGYGGLSLPLCSTAFLAILALLTRVLTRRCASRTT